MGTNLAQELEPLDVAVPLLTLPDHCPIQHIECGKQSGCAMTLVIMSHDLCPPLLQWETRLSPVQSLHLTLFVTRQYQRIFGWIHVQADDVLQLFDKLRIT